MINVSRYYKPLPHTVFISGGMSGIGAEITKAFIRCGTNVAIFDVQNDIAVVESMKALCVSSSQQISVYVVDMRDAQRVERTVEKAANEVGKPNLAINSAGIMRTAPFEQLDYETFKLVVDINLMGSRNFAASVTPYMGRGDHLALIASLAGIVGTYTQAAYAASKFGVVGLAEVLHLELNQQGIDVSVICPGEIETPLLAYERKHGKEATKNLNAFAGVLSVDKACEGILKGLGKRQFMITPGIKALFTREFSKKASWLFRKIANVKLVNELRK